MKSKNTPVDSPLADAHCHLQDPAFAPDLEDALRDARLAGVRVLVINGTRPEDWPRVRELASAHLELVPCFGLHPWFAGEAPPGWLDALRGFLAGTPSGVGEAGLDARRGTAGQGAVFREQLALARERELPLMVHCVGAWGELLALLRKDGAPRPGFLLHAYGGSAEAVPTLAGLGAFFSFAARDLQDIRPRTRRALLAVPPDRLLLETDGPGPRTRGGPADVRAALTLAAALRGEDRSALARTLWENTERLLGTLLRSPRSS